MAQQQRAFERKRHRIACELLHDGRRSFGTVVDISASGLFVRMGPSESPPLNADVQIEWNDPEHGRMTLLAKVTRIKRVRRDLVALVDGGIGLTVRSAPETYYSLLKSLITS
jgi:hypothetical protein